MKKEMEKGMRDDSGNRKGEDRRHGGERGRRRDGDKRKRRE